MPTSKTRRTLRLLGVWPRSMEGIQEAEFVRRWWQTPEERQREHDWPELLDAARFDDLEWLPLLSESANSDLSVWFDIQTRIAAACRIPREFLKRSK
jgi:hypothetical protein